MDVLLKNHSSNIDTQETRLGLLKNVKTHVIKNKQFLLKNQMNLKV